MNMPVWIIIAILLSIAATCGLAWVLRRINQGPDEKQARDAKRGQGDGGGDAGPLYVDGPSHRGEAASDHGDGDGDGGGGDGGGGD